MARLEKQQVMILVVGGFILAGFGVFRYAPILRQKQSLKAEMEKHSLAVEQVGDHLLEPPGLALREYLHAGRAGCLHRLPAHPGC